jgi:hypothetical protein
MPRSRPPDGRPRRASRVVHALLYVGALGVVYAGHRAVLGAGGYGARAFWRAGWERFDEALGALR